MVFAPAIKTMSGATLHHFVLMLLMSNWYFVVLISRVFAANLLSEYVNSINYMVNSIVGAYGGGWLYGWPMTHNMSGLNIEL